MNQLNALSNRVEYYGRIVTFMSNAHQTITEP
jgi:hypothetical protein